MESVSELKNILRDKINDKDDKIMLFKILDKISESIKNKEGVCTNFLNMNQLNLIKQYINYPYMYFCGGGQYNERNLAIICPYEETNIGDILINNISYIKIEYEKYFKDVSISHRDVLGSILSLGINRELIGDIYIGKECSYVISKKEITKFLIDNLNKIRNVKVKLKEVNKNEIDCDTSDKKEEKILVSSMRLDNILSSVLNTSRSKINVYFEENKIFVNWKNEIKKEKILKNGDVISVRGVGRIVIKESAGISKKGKIILNIDIYK